MAPSHGRRYQSSSGDFQAPDPSAIIELFELQLFANIHGVNDIYRFHAGTNLVNNGEVVWKGNPYLRFPVEADGFEYTGQGALPRPKIRISNILGSITAILLSMPNGLEAAKVTRIRTLGRYLDAANFPVSGDILLTEDSDAHCCLKMMAPYCWSQSTQLKTSRLSSRVRFTTSTARVPRIVRL
jgi:lambda family phage minor tail protein L